eukprot:CAMPEP_0203668012 /NCGR_PEP_ID=MMETSP0090-20130426/4725_1 /ASSEMBLY_ACC=CAM_ASM_001088 /TAXON_ID=426623 /ORGANISM="Chaetoceros affinis, Strain CCMP159" /LENGTH=215 /DNA_ID=CAMNT_0050532325 /DNA_START=320 /DNA_END=968 /DNA_ORIENTATION=-
MSWERSRFIPWSRIQDVSGPDGYESQKEKVYRALAREATREKDLLEHSKNNASQATPNAQSFVPPEVLAQQAQKKKGLFNSGVDYSTPDLVRTLAFGGCIGAITGYWVSIWLHGWDENSTGKLYQKNASNMAKTKYLIEGTSRSGIIFGAFFSGFHCLKYGIRIATDPGLVYEAIGASVLSLGALAAKPATRPSLPYAAMLIGMDCFSIYMKEDV